MFIIIDDDTVEKLGDATNSFDSTVMVIDRLFELMYLGKHIVYSSAPNLKTIKECPYINQRTSQFIVWILREFSRIYSCKNIVKKCVYISSTCSGVEEDNGNYKVPIDYAIDLNETKLLTENETDAKCFIEISKFMKRKKSISSLFSICYENDSYHGANGKAKIEQVAEKNSFVLCVVDTDKDYPDDGRKDTYRCVNDAVKKVKKSVVIDLLELPVREKENLFPAKVYSEFTDNKLIALISRCYSENEAINNYFDIKDGLKYKKYLNRNEKWNKYFEELITECDKYGICHGEYGEDDLEKVYIEGIGDKICDGVVDSLLIGDRSLMKKHFSLTNEQIEGFWNKREQVLCSLPKFVFDNWEKISISLFDWGCCVDQKRFPAQRSW